jgi:antitoxin component of MazEF toxin-antitoxin module
MLDSLDNDLIIETLEYRLDNDEELIIKESLKEELQELLRKLEEGDEYI